MKEVHVLMSYGQLPRPKGRGFPRKMMKQHYTDWIDDAVDVSDSFEPMKGKKDRLKRSQRKQEKEFREMRKRGRGRKYSLS